MKRFISKGFAAFLFMFVLIGCEVSTSDTVDYDERWDRDAQNFTYAKEAHEYYDGIRIEAYHGDDDWVKVPNYIDGLPVTIIDEDAFEATEVTRIAIPNTMRHLGSQALNTGALETVEFYGDYAGKVSKWITNDDFYEIIDDHENACFTSGETPPSSYVGHTFPSGCPVVEVLEISDPVDLGGTILYGYTVVVDLAHYEKAPLQTFSAAAINMINAETLTHITLNDRIERVSMFDHVQMPSLEYVNVPEKNPHLNSVDGVLFDDDMEQLLIYPSAHEASVLEIPATLQGIFTEQFYGANNLETFSVHPGNTNFFAIEGVLFNHDRTELILYPAGKPEASYAILDTVTMIHDMAFVGAKYLETLHIPESVETLGTQNTGAEIFYDTARLKAFDVDEGNTTYTSRDGVLFKDTRLIAYPQAKEATHYEIPEDVDTIAMHAFGMTRYLEHVHINAQITTIEPFTFAQAKNLTTITFDEASALETIKMFAFRNVESLQEIIIPDTVTTIEAGAFIFAKRLESIYIPESVETMGPDVFYGATGVIYAEADSKPDGWHSRWNSHDLDVVWGYEKDAD